ncbi:MAG: type II toxin-antitoxin system VapC family toxin [Magnetococcales bacterium]|nr:type II toxin-antitoxin system VapC family toxin [Magnetococcales bacterium]
MRILLDTHTFLWWIEASDRLSSKAMEVISDRHNTCYLSLVSVWEVAIKIGLGKLSLSEPLEYFIGQELKKNKFRQLGIRLWHVSGVSTLPLHHRDPFDRLLISQALMEGMPILSADEVIDAYGVTRWW